MALFLFDTGQHIAKRHPVKTNSHINGGGSGGVDISRGNVVTRGDVAVVRAGEKIASLDALNLGVVHRNRAIESDDSHDDPAHDREAREEEQDLADISKELRGVRSAGTPVVDGALLVRVWGTGCQRSKGTSRKRWPRLTTVDSHCGKFASRYVR